MKCDVWFGRQDARPVSSVADLDEVLDEAETLRGDGGAALVVTIIPVVVGAQFDELPGLEIGLGHPDRAFIFFGTAEGVGSGYGVESGVEEWPTVIGWDYSGSWTDYEPAKTRVTSATAREAARQYVRTGQRPTCVEWPAD